MIANELEVNRLISVKFIFSKSHKADMQVGGAIEFIAL